ncbi:MAG: hypothetical protein QXV81_01680 [Ignisphaera sp.]
MKIEASAQGKFSMLSTFIDLNPPLLLSKGVENEWMFIENSIDCPRKVIV